MNNFITVFNFEFKQYLKKKSTIIVFLIYFLLVFGATFIPALFGEGNKFSGIFSKDNSDFSRSAYIVDAGVVDIDTKYLKEAKKYETKEQIEKDIIDKKLDEAVIITKDKYEYLTESSIAVNQNISSEFKIIFDNFIKQKYYTNQGYDYAKIKELEQYAPQAIVVPIGSSGDFDKLFIKTAAAYFLAFILYMTVLMYGTVTANNVIREKTNRAMELLLVTVKPSTLIVGKVFAFSLVAILQVSSFVLAYLIGVSINKSKYSEMISFAVEVIDIKFILVWSVFALTGLVMLLFMYSAFASLASKIEELNTVLTLPMVIFIGAFFANIYTMGAGSGSVIATFLSYFPLTSYFCMLSRYSTSSVSNVDLLISYGILLTTTIFIAYLSVVIYRRATLRYGQKLSVIKLLRKK